MSLIQTTPLPKQDSRQWPMSMEIKFDFTAGNLAIGAHSHPGVFTVPAGARITGGEVVVDTVWANAGAGTALLDIGDGADPNRYTSTAVNLENLQHLPLTLTGYRYAETDTIDFLLTVGVEVASGGVCHVRIEYTVEDRAHEVQE